MKGDRFQPRVLVVPPSYFARERTVGGGERYALEYARALSAFTPTTLALFDTTASCEQQGSLTVKAFAVRHFNQRRGFPLTRQSWNELKEYDVIHAMVFPTPLTDLLMLEGRLRGQTLVLTDVGGGGSCWSTYLQKLHPRLSLNRLAHGLALLSEHAASFFTEWPHPKKILFGGVNLETFPATPVPEGGYALFIGRLLSHKGVLPLIECVSADTPLHIVGRAYDKDYLARLQKAAEGKKVTFVMDADDARLRAELAGSAVVLQPSLPSDDPGGDKSELLGLVNLEAMASGRPVIVTRTCSLPELVRNGETGFIVPPGDQTALREKIELLLKDAGLAGRMGAAARAHIERNFTWPLVATRGLEFYQELVRARKRL
ncbi:MAG TPA: glycosyltransferase family 4 protein [Verrucomicrobiae bacterium]